VPWLVDGDNLLGTWPGRTRTAETRRELAMGLARLGARERRRIVTVFDGRRPALAFGADVLFAGGRSADDVLLEFLREQPRPAEWIVVTSDRPLGDRCRHLGARVERSDRFRRRLAPGAGSEKPERETDIEGWLEVFGDDSEDGGPGPR